MTEIKPCFMDIETFKRLFLLCEQYPDGNRRQFEISSRCNDLYAMVKHLKERDFEFHVSFNGLSFDSQVIQFILDEYEKWLNLSNLEIVEKIYEFAQMVIDNQNYDNIRPIYKEEYLEIPQIDLFTIHHYNNKARICSLKWIEFSINQENIDEIPVFHGKDNLSEEEIDRIIEYCWVDIEATKSLYYITRGETNISNYKGKDKIQDRFDLIDELGFPLKALNYSDVKIGDEINRRGYKSIKKINDKELYELKKNRRPTPAFTFGNCVPRYVKFKTKELQEFYKSIKDVRVNLNTKQEFKITFRGTTYSIMKGGIHSEDPKRIIIPQEGRILRDADVGSQYPNAIVKREISPSHLGKEWLINYKNTINTRLTYKAKAKESPKFNGLQETYKLALNGGGFGKLNEKESWQYDPICMFKCTIGNEFEILMLIEMLEEAGIHIISANTDGILALFDDNLQEKYKELCEEWEIIVGNDKMGKLEFTDFTKFVQLSVNDYIALKKDGEVKKKGDFSTEFELHKNKSRRIIPLALEQYFIHNTPPEETIRKHTNIFDFCIGAKSSRNFHYEGVKKATGEVIKYNKLIRYYISTEGEKLYKIKNEGVETNAPQVRECEADIPYQTVFNKAWKSENMQDYKIDYDYYIKKTYDIIHKIEPKPKTLKNQLTLF